MCGFVAGLFLMTQSTDIRFQADNAVVERARLGTLGLSLQIFKQESRQQVVKVGCRVFPFVNRMGAIGVGHHGESLVVKNQFIDQSLEALVMHIVISRSVYDEMIAFQVFGIIDG